MADLIALSDTKDYLRVDGTADDATLATLIAAASEAVTGLANGWDPTDPVPERLKLATLMLVADWFTNREAVTVGTTAAPAPYGVQWLAHDYRKMAI
jgi:hypothetical protein